MLVYIITVIVVVCIFLLYFSAIQFQLRIITKNSNNYSFFVLKFLYGIIRLKFNITLSPLIEKSFSLISEKTHSQVQPRTILKDIISNAIGGNHSFTPYIRHMKNSITKVKIKKFTIILKLGVGDAAQTALLSGLIITTFASLKGYLFNKFGLKDSNLSLEPSFNEKKLDVDLDCIIDIKLGHIIVIGIRLIVDKLKGGEINGRTSY